MFEMLRWLLRAYRDTLDFHRRLLLDQFELTHFARKVVGVGSVGTVASIYRCKFAGGSGSRG
jgi:hypothetical protein